MHRLLWVWLVLALMGGTGGAIADASPVEKAVECGGRENWLDRLACYDALFRQEDSGPQALGLLPPLWHAIHAIEAERPEGDMTPWVRERGEDVLISVPAFGTTPPRPLLVVACESNITHLQLHLPWPLDATRAQLILSGGGVELHQVWRLRHDGHVASGGRGLPAIETLRQLQDSERLVVGSDLPELDALQFELVGMREHLEPLRTRCRW